VVVFERLVFEVALFDVLLLVCVFVDSPWKGARCGVKIELKEL